MEKNTGRVFLVKHLKLIVLFEHFKLIGIPKEIFMIYRLTHYIRLSDSRKFDQFSWWSRWQLGQFFSTEIHFQVSLRFKCCLRKLIHVELEEFDEGSYQTNLARTSQNELTAILSAKSLGMCM